MPELRCDFEALLCIRRMCCLMISMMFNLFWTTLCQNKPTATYLKRQNHTSAVHHFVYIVGRVSFEERRRWHLKGDKHTAKFIALHLRFSIDAQLHVIRLDSLRRVCNLADTSKDRITSNWDDKQNLFLSDLILGRFRNKSKESTCQVI